MLSRLNRIARSGGFPQLFSTDVKTKTPLTAADNTAPALLSSDLRSVVRYAKDVVAPFQIYSLINQDGTVRGELPKLDPSEWRKLYSHMVRLSGFFGAFCSQ
jgi:hypothetical protein